MSRVISKRSQSQSSQRAHAFARCALAVACAFASLAALSCNEEPPPPQLARFNRPNRVDFVCVNGTEVVPREQCRARDANSTLSAHALVTQAGRGEIAVVNLRTRQVIDSRRDIPGYTFIPVGETPTAIVVPKVHAGQTYVASFGSRDVRVLRTRALIATVNVLPDAQRVALTAADGTLVAPTDMVLAPDENALFVAAPDAGLVLRLPIQRCDAASAPGCEDGLIDEAGIARLELPTVADEPPAAVEPSEPSVYQELCEFPRQALPTAEPIVVSDLDEALREAPARPSALALDAFCLEGESCTRRLLVADTAQPVIHAIDIDAWAQGGGQAALLAPIVTGVPTKAVVVTPRVPSNLGFDSTAETQYVYGIDARDGSVLVIENGQVLNINSTPGERTDRLLFDGGREGALALEVMTPGFDVDAPAAQYVDPPVGEPLPDAGDPLACRDETFDLPDPARLRGVFLAVALTDGTIRVIDVHDMELRANDGSDEACRTCPRQSPPPIPLLVRNQQRLATSFIPIDDDEQPTFVPAAALTFGVDGVSFAVRADGSTASPRTPRIACIACDGLERALPIDNDNGGAGGSDDEDAGVPSDDDETCGGDTPALLCVSNDPWSSGEDRWRVVYEGALPTAVENRGHFVPDGPKTGGLELVTDSDPCAAGVLGEEDIALDYPPLEKCKAVEEMERNPSGDQVVITSDPLDREQLSLLGRKDDQTLGLCATLKAELDDDPKLRVAFEIRRAYEDRLVVREAMVRPIGDAKRFEDVRRCYEDTISFSVHTLDAFTVWGAQSGFQHRVRANAAGRCAIDPDPELALRAGRARFDCEFRNNSLQFKLGQVPKGSAGMDLDEAQLIGVELSARFTSRAAKLVMRAYDLGFGNANVVTEQLLYNDVDGKLYLVDINARGLVPIPLDPLPGALSSAAQFN